MKPFVVVPEGDLWYIMQVCPDVCASVNRACPVSLYCDCEHSEHGPLWQFRGYYDNAQKAQDRCDILTAQFLMDVERHRGVMERRRAREVREVAAKLPENIGDDDVPY